MTNFEKLKSMEVYELAGFLDIITTCCALDACEDCPLKSAPLKSANDLIGCTVGGIYKWLESEVADD